MKKGWTKVEPEAVRVAAGAFRSVARYLAPPPAGEVVAEPGRVEVVVVAGVEEELQAASRVPAASTPRTRAVPGAAGTP